MREFYYASLRLICGFLRSKRSLKNWIYNPLKVLLRRKLLTLRFHLSNVAATSEPKEKAPESLAEDRQDNSARIGILSDPLGGYEHYVAACVKAEVPCQVIDLFASDWIDRVRLSKCNVFVVWPGECIAEWKKLFDERLLFLTSDLGKQLYPSYESLWLYGSKERQRDWLKIHGLPHPETWIFHREKDALEFVRQAAYPLVAKTDIGAASYGVRVLKTRRQGERLIRQVFSSGIVGHCADRSAWQWQHSLFQEYLAGDIEEWRMVRIGDSFFGHLKERGRDGKHSGSGLCQWEDPGKELLDLLKRVTDAGHFRSMCLDIFKTADGRLLINECQAVFGCSVATTQMKIHGVPGRYLLVNGTWQFEAGEYCGNYMCDLRIKSLIDERAI